MLVHDIRRNKSHLIDFRESAPGALREEALQRFWETKVGTLVRRGGVSLYYPFANPSITLLNIYYGDKEELSRMISGHEGDRQPPQIK